MSAATRTTPEETMASVEYTPDQLKGALDSLLTDSENPAFDGRHIFGYGEENHDLSKLQTITATRILDYDSWMNDPLAPSQEKLLQEAKTFSMDHGPMLNLQTVIADQAPRMALAAEFKRASPSKGDIAVHLSAGEQAKTYASSGANIISVLTEPRWFKGSLADMQEARLESTTKEGRPAILRKEFIVNEYMIAEAASRGADTVLLIVAVLPQHLLERLIAFCRTVGMEPLVEVHADVELEVALEAGAKVIGVNNRNLHTFQMDLGNTQHMAELLEEQKKTFAHGNSDAEYTLCALSGMSTAFDVHRYRQSGVGMCLIGESLMRAPDPQQAIAGLCLDPEDFERETAAGLGGPYNKGTKLIKVCGITNSEDALVACQSGANLIGVIFVPKSKRCVTSEQAKEVVQTVRSFGERSTTTSLQDAGASEPLAHLVSMSQSLENGAGRRPMVVGVFQNQSPSFIREMASECGLDMVQLHGQEGMEACNVEETGVPAIRVVDIETDPETGKASSSAVEDLLNGLTNDPTAILLDTSIKGSKEGGGTGVTFDWEIARKIQETGLPVIIAGGLSPDNVAEAVGTVGPWGIDVSSGVEAAPGTKDHDKVKAFLKNARKAALESNKGF